MNDLVAGLNPEQREVALYRGHCLAVACPGSGKTKTLATKAALQLNEGLKVAAVTFTRDAAIELRDRIVRLAEPGCKPRLLVGTFHSIDMLMAFPKKFKGEYGRNILAAMDSPFVQPWNIVKEGVRRSYVLRAMQQAGLKMMMDEASSIIERVKASPNAIDLDESHRVLVETYLALMTESKHIDFQDIILNTNAALRNKTLTPLAVDSLLLDEYQDTDAAQYEWSVLHGRAGIPITAVGDDDQSIYGFRRALGYGGMDRFAKEFNALRVLLGTNYRCHAEILRSAEHLITRNTERIDKILHANKGPGGIVHWETFPSQMEEYAAVAEEAYIASQENAGFAVIARTNKELTNIQGAMVSRGVRYRRTDGRSIFDCPEVQVFAAILRCIIKPVPNDVDMVLAWAGMNNEDTAEIRRLFGTNIRIGSSIDFKNSKVSEDGAKKWRSFAKKHAEWGSALLTNSFRAINLGVYEWLDENLQKPNSPEVLRVARSMFDVDNNTLQEQLQKCRNAELKSREDEKTDDSESVAWLITAHGSKGLEYDRVWIVGLQAGEFPSEKSSLEEERRLMYVAMTRARNMLWVSATKEGKPSMFAYESNLLPSP